MEVAGLEVSYEKRKIIKGIDFCFQSGEITAVLGPNGAGKSTFMKGMAGIIKADCGQALYDDETSGGKINIMKLPPGKRAKIIAYVPQHSELGFRYSVWEFTAMGTTHFSNLWGYGKRQDELVKEALAYVGITHLKDCYIDQLSGGELRLAYLARCYAQQTEWMFLDEPTAGLDYRREHEFLRKLREYGSGHTNSVVFTIHNPLMAMDYADRIVFMDKGAIVGDVYMKEQWKDPLKQMFIKIYGEEITNTILKERLGRC